MRLIRVLHKISDVLDKIMEAVIVVMLLAMVAVTGAQIVCRLASHSLAWSEELTRYLLIWSSMLGAGCVYKHGGHISVTVLQDLVPENAAYIMRMLCHLLCMILFAVIVVYGIKYYGKQGTQLSAALKWPMRYVYLGVTIGAAAMFVHALDAFFTLLFRTDRKEEN